MEIAIYILSCTTLMLGFKFLEHLLVIKNMKAQREIDRRDIDDALTAINSLAKDKKMYEEHYAVAYNQNTYLRIQLEETRTVLEVYQTLYGEKEES